MPYTREGLPGFDPSYRFGSDEEIDQAINHLIAITKEGGGGGIVSLDENDEVVKKYTGKVALELPETMPAEIKNEARAAALTVLQIMQRKNAA